MSHQGEPTAESHYLWICWKRRRLGLLERRSARKGDLDGNGRALILQLSCNKRNDGFKEPLRLASRNQIHTGLVAPCCGGEEVREEEGESSLS